MDQISYKTISVNKATAERKWVIIDADSAVLGRLSSQVASILRGKTKTSYTPHAECGDYVIVINCDKIRLTGKKWDQKTYVRHTGYPGGQRFTTAKQLYAKSSTRLILNAVKGMLPKNRLGRKLLTNLHCFEDAAHGHEAQQPTPITLKY